MKRNGSSYTLLHPPGWCILPTKENAHRSRLVAISNSWIFFFFWKYKIFQSAVGGVGRIDETGQDWTGETLEIFSYLRLRWSRSWCGWSSCSESWDRKVSRFIGRPSPGTTARTTFVSTSGNTLLPTHSSMLFQMWAWQNDNDKTILERASWN